MVRDTFIYLSSTIFAKSIPFCLLPYITRLVPQHEIGKATLFMLYWAIINALISGNSHSYLSRRYYHHDKEERQPLIINILISNIISLIFYTSLIFYVSRFFPEMFSPFNNIILLVPALALIQVFITLSTTVYRFERKPWRYMMCEMGMSITLATTTLLYITYINDNWYYQFWGLVSGLAVTFIITIIKSPLERLTPPSYSEVKAIILFCIPQTMHLLSGLLLAIGDRYLIGQLISTRELAIYAATYLLCTTYLVLADAYTRSYAPEIYRLLKLQGNASSDAIKLLIKSGCGFLVVCVCSYLAIISLFDTIFPIQYNSGKSLVPYLMLGFYFFTIYKILYPFIIVYRRQNYVVITSIITAITGLLILKSNLQSSGLHLAAIVTMISYMAVAKIAILLCVSNMRSQLFSSN